MSVRRGNSLRVVGVLARGFAMGSADLVPGVSGGTVAFVTGIYEPLVESVSSGSRAMQALVTGRIRKGLGLLGDVDWLFLGPLVIGAGVAIFTLAGLLERLLREQPVRMAGFFFGLILGTLFVAWRMMRRPKTEHGLIVLVVGLVAFAGFGLQSSAVVNPSGMVYTLSGMMAIVAFVLPGISGSFMLLTIGMYQPVIGAVADRDLGPMLLFGVGAVFGLAVFARILERLLETQHDRVVASVTGLMIGSFRILWPWPNGLGGENGVGATELAMPSGDVGMPTLLALAGAVLVIVLALAADRDSSSTAELGTVGVDDQP